MWPFSKNPRQSDLLFHEIMSLAVTFRNRLNEAVESGLIRQSERHALVFVTLGAGGATFNFLADGGAPFKKIRRSDLPFASGIGLGNPPLDAYFVLVKIFFYLLSKSMEADHDLSSKIGTTVDDLLGKFADVTEFSADMFDIASLQEIESREHYGAALDVSLADFRMTLCGRIEGLPEWRAPGAPKGSYVSTVLFSRTILQEVAARNLAILRSNLA